MKLKFGVNEAVTLKLVGKLNGAIQLQGVLGAQIITSLDSILSTNSTCLVDNLWLNEAL